MNIDCDRNIEPQSPLIHLRLLIDSRTKNGCEEEICLKVFFYAPCSKKIGNRESSIILFQKKSSRGCFCWRRLITPSTDGKMIKLLTFDNYFPPLRHSRRFCKFLSRMTKAIAFSRWNDAGAIAHYLVLRKSYPRSFPCLGISRSLLRTWSKHSGTQI